MRPFKPEDYPNHETSGIPKGALPDKPNWLEVGTLVKALSPQGMMDARAEWLIGQDVPEVGDLFRIVAIEEHPSLRNWFGITLQTLDGRHVGQGTAFALYDPEALPDIRHNFEPMGDG